MSETTNVAVEPEQGKKFSALLGTFVIELSDRDKVLSTTWQTSTRQVPTYQMIDALNGREKVAFLRCLFEQATTLRTDPRGYSSLAGEDGYTCLAYRDLFRCH